MAIKASISKLNASVLNYLINMNLNLVIILAVVKLSLSLNTKLTQEFLIKLKAVQHSVLFTCIDTQSLKDLASNLSEAGANFDFYTTNRKDEMKNLPKILNRRLIAKCGVVVDTNCEGFENVLQQASNYHFFNRTYHWLVIHDSAIDKMEIFHSNLKGIQIGSQITYAKKTEHSYSLIDVYSKAFHLGTHLIFEEFGNWNPNNGFNITKNLYPIYNKENRGNFNGLTLRGATIIDRDDVFPRDVDQLLSSTEMMVGISQSTKYHYILAKMLSKHYNFNVKYRVLRTWAGLLPSGFRLGVVGVIMRSEADIVAAGFWKRVERHDIMDNYHHSWYFE